MHEKASGKQETCHNADQLDWTCRYGFGLDCERLFRSCVYVVCARGPLRPWKTISTHESELIKYPIPLH